MRVDFTKLRFIVIDDNTYMRRVVRALLHGFGAREVFEAEDGAIGLESFMSHSPDVVILDWEMPILDGIEVTRMIRQPTASVNPYVPIIMLTGHTERRRVALARDAGVTEFVAKPMSSKTLYDRVFAVVAHPRAFVKTKTYFGPDRRRGVQAGYSGPERRKEAAESIPQRAIADRLNYR